MVWDQTTPEDTDPIRQGANSIRTMKADLQTALSTEGVFPGATPAAPVFRWKPRTGSVANRPANDPVNPGTLYYDTDANQLELDNGTAWVALTNLVPVATIQAYGGTVAPGGWLLCDGSQVSRTTYANLYAIVGNAFGVGDGSTTFNLPDLRGRFLRGIDNGAGVDPDTGTRTAMNTGGNAGDNIGSVQAGATKTPVSPFTNGYPAGSITPGSTASGWVFTSSQGAGSTQSDWIRAASSLNLPAAQNVAGGDNETRPVNAYVQFIIKT